MSTFHNHLDSHETHNPMGCTMSMTFNKNNYTDLLFSWLSTDKIGFFSQITLCLLAGILSVVLKLLRNKVENQLIRCTDSLQEHLKLYHLLICNVCRSIMVFVILVWDYFLMLAAMTMNLYIFLSVTLGVAIGFLLFGHLLNSHITLSDVQKKNFNNLNDRQAFDSPPTSISITPEYSAPKQREKIEEPSCCGNVCP